MLSLNEMKFIFTTVSTYKQSKPEQQQDKLGKK